MMVARREVEAIPLALTVWKHCSTRAPSQIYTGLTALSVVRVAHLRSDDAVCGLFQVASRCLVVGGGFCLVAWRVGNTVGAEKVDDIVVRQLRAGTPALGCRLPLLCLVRVLQAQHCLMSDMLLCQALLLI